MRSAPKVYLTHPSKNLMKIILSFAITALLALPASAEYRTWTNKEGQAAEMKLTQVGEVEGEKVGKFILRNGKWATIRQSQLSSEDAKRLEHWTPPPSGDSSVFDDYLWGKLVSLQGEELKTAKISSKPKKYYVFYYTASWCGPCRKFTPSLVEWYNKNKNDNFEIFLISSDRNEPAMVNYAKSKKMEWPHVAYDQIKAFKTKFRSEHGVRGIPMLIVCTPDGKVLGNFRSQLPRLTTMVK